MSDKLTWYCAGFLFDEDRQHVALIHKNKPSWQAGKYNAIGGKIEVDELPVEAMRREFREEAGLDHDEWDHFATVTFKEGAVWFYRAFISDWSDVRTMEEEEVFVIPIADLWNWPCLPNLSWLIPLALYQQDRYSPVVAMEEGSADVAELSKYREAMT